MKKYIKRILMCLIRKIDPPKNEKFIPNINCDITKKQKKVLLIYLDFITSSKQVECLDDTNISGAIHTNRYELFQIIQALIRMNYCIDVCGHYEEEAVHYIEEKKYDVIIGLGTMFRYAINQSKAKKILYLTENPYYISYAREQERIDYFKERHNIETSLFRTGMFFKENDENNVNAIICMGEVSYLSHLNIPVQRIYPSAFKNERFCINRIEKRKKNCFLVLGTDGFIHKGNDLLIEVFNCHQEWELYLCGYEVSKTIKDLGLVMSENIHDCGYIDIKSGAFEELVSICSFILLPSCSEALSTAVLTGMRHALIPIVMHGIGLDELENLCFYFEGYHLNQIENKIEELVSMTDEEIRVMSERIYTYANEKFTLEQFTENIYQAINCVCNELKL